MLEHEGRTLSPSELADYWADLASRYPIVSIEDGMDEEDWDGWKPLTERDRRPRAARRRRPVRDQHRAPARAASTPGVANSILMKVNQIGTLTETLEAIAHGPRGRLHGGDVAPLGRDRGRRRSPTSRSPPAAARSRPARPSRSDRVAKYNQLLRIEEALGADATYPGRSRLPRLTAAQRSRRRDPAPGAKAQRWPSRICSRTRRRPAQRRDDRATAPEGRARHPLGPGARVALLAVLGIVAAAVRPPAGAG